MAEPAEESTQEPTPVGFSEADIRAHNEHDHLAAVFVDREHAAAAVDELRSLGLGSPHLGIAVHGDEVIAFEHDAEAELISDTEIGAVLGAPIGVIAGIGLAALAVPGVGVIGVGGVLALAGVSGLWGGMLGAYLGAAVGSSGWTAHEDIAFTALRPGEVLVVVCSHGHGDAVRAALERHTGRLHLIPAGRL